MSSYKDWVDYFAGKHNVPYSANETWGKYFKNSAYNAVPALLNDANNMLLFTGDAAAASDPGNVMSLTLGDAVKHSDKGERILNNLQRDALLRAKAIPAGLVHTVTHPAESFHNDPVGTVQLLRGLAGGARSGLGAAASRAEAASRGPYPASPGAVTARSVAAAARAGQGGASALEAGLSLPFKAVAGLRPARPTSVFSPVPVKGNPFALSREAEEALASSGLSESEQARVRSSPTVLREWEKTSQHGKSGNPIGVSPDSLRQAILQHSGVSPENISYSAATSSKPVNPGVAAKMNASARGELPSQEQAAAEAGPVKFGEYTFKDGRWYSPNGMALGDFASDSMTKASGIDTSQPGPQAANPAGVTDIAHNILDRSDALVADRAAQAGQGRIGRAAKGAADIGAGLLSGYIGARVNPVLGTLAGLATGYATDQMLQGPVSSIGSASPAVEQFGAPPVAPTPKYGLPLAMGVAASAREPRDAATQGSGEEYTDIIGPPPEFNGDAQSPHGESYSDVASPPPTQSQGGRVAYKKGGKVNASVEPLVQDLMSRYKHAKTAETATTKPLLQHHDKAIVTALSIAKKAI